MSKASAPINVAKYWPEIQRVSTKKVIELNLQEIKKLSKEAQKVKPKPALALNLSRRIEELAQETELLVRRLH